MKKIIGFIFLSLLFVTFFFNAFSTFYFNDDFYFLKLSKKLDLIAFFSPIRTTFYRPLSTEFFYYLLQKLPFPSITGHIFVFLVFLVGVYFLYKTLIIITKNKIAALFSTLLYLFHFSHVYQLYWFATFQEVAQFTLLIGSLYFLLNKRFLISIFLFLCALFSKEQALLFPFVAFLFYYIRYKRMHPIFIIYFLLDFVFVCIHYFVNSHMPVLAEYAIHLSPKLFVNNLLWYGLWSLGFPAMMSDYMRSIFSLPFGAFWNYFKQPTFCIYFFGMITFFIALSCMTFCLSITKIKERKPILIHIVFALILFSLFLLPVLPIIHKWMVRLTIPLILVVSVEGFILAFFWKNKSTKPLVIFLGILYLVWNYFGVKQHEVMSTYKLESSITKRAAYIFNDTKRFENCQILYIKNPPHMKMSSWDGSEKIALTFAGDSFLSYYFPDRKDMKVVYEYRTKVPVGNNCSIDARELIQ